MATTNASVTIPTGSKWVARHSLGVVLQVTGLVMRNGAEYYSTRVVELPASAELDGEELGRESEQEAPWFDRRGIRVS